ncbi:carbohydrate ABC transporter permease [Desertimonas flava]|jgi:multiple sugar transport system permease protein|uniref:carbohydrate ABC transporter permease n=1 Tax=Desertimonas flava TaxID=2064846 RepID=UPI000E3428E9|nr:carbohydrate ABC transporter permease [Desertimonas flava]
MASTLAPGRSRTAGSRRDWSGVGLNLLLYGGFVVMAIPFVWMILSSFKTSAEMRQWPPTWIPKDPTTENYRELFERLDFPRYFLNSIISALAVTAGNLLFCSMIGYALAKLDFPGKRVLLAIMLGTMMIPSFVTFMPLFVFVSNMNLTNTRAGLILPFLAGAFGAFLMRQYMLGLPDELLDAARVDGAGELRIFFRIVLPLCGPALATLGVLTFLTNWNSFLWPLVVATGEDMYTLPVALALFSTGQQRSNVALQMAGAVIVVLPVVVLFFAMQRYVIRGIATSGLK